MAWITSKDPTDPAGPAIEYGGEIGQPLSARWSITRHGQTYLVTWLPETQTLEALEIAIGWFRDPTTTFGLRDLAHFAQWVVDLRRVVHTPTAELAQAAPATWWRRTVLAVRRECPSLAYATLAAIVLIWMAGVMARLIERIP